MLTPSSRGEPVVQHWGEPLGELSGADLLALADVRTPGTPHSALDEPRDTGLVPLSSSGFTGTPLLELGRPGVVVPVRLSDWRCVASDDRVELTASDVSSAAVRSPSDCPQCWTTGSPVVEGVSTRLTPSRDR